MDTIKMFKLVTGEMVITSISGTREDGGYELSYPLMVVPIPPDQARGMQGQIGFMKFMPFSDYKEPIVIFPSAIAVDSDADKKISGAYEQQVKQIRAQESGIVIPGPGSAPDDFSKLNT